MATPRYLKDSTSRANNLRVEGDATLSLQTYVDKLDKYPDTPGTGVATALATNVGSAGAPVVNGGALGTPSSGTLTNATGLPVSTGLAGLGAGWTVQLGKAVAAVLTVTTYTALTALTTATGLIDGAVYRNVAYDSVGILLANGDGANGEWIYDADSSATANGVTVLAMATAPGRMLRQFTGPILDAWAGMKGDGSDQTDKWDALIDACVAHDQPLRMVTEGSFIIEDYLAPLAFRGADGPGKDKLTISIKVQTLPAGAMLIRHGDSDTNAGTNDYGLAGAAPTVPIRYSGFTLDVDDAEFADCYAFWIDNATDVKFEDVEVYGRGAIHYVARKCINAIFDHCDSETTGSGETVGIYGDTVGSARRVARYCKFIGGHSYGVNWQMGDGDLIEHCWAEDIDSGFAFSINYGWNGKIVGGWSWDSSHEAFQFTDSHNCEAVHGFARWTSPAGGDFACSINGTDGSPPGAQPAKNCRHHGHVFFDSWAAAGCIANETEDCEISGLLAVDCARRGTFATPSGGHSIALSCYTDIAATCKRPVFRDNKIVAENGPISTGYAETAGGSGTIVGARVVHNLFLGQFTALYGDVQTDTLIYSLQTESFTPVVTASSGTFTTVSATMQFKRQGDHIVVILCNVTITDAGTASGAILMTLPTDCSAITPGGAGSGWERSVVGYMVSARFSGGTATLLFYNNTSPIATGYNITFSGIYQKAQS